ncbi:immunoglobulin-like domain-containing protein [Cohnella nanjingensis]|nr:immunoglobulin-like domain-containing protein [Cohnella nanjingensis]
MVIALSLVSSGCEGQPRSDSVSTPSVVVDTTVAQLIDTVGNPDQVKRSARLPREQALAAANDYHPTTGKWFEEENGFNLITSYSSGDTEADSQVVAALGMIPDGRSVRFQLTSRDQTGKRVEQIAEYVADHKNTVDGRLDFSHKMPVHPDTNYLLSIEILSPEGLVEDTFISPLFVPPNELNARLNLKPPAADAGQTALSIYNAGPTDLYLGYGYGIYKKEAAGWKLVPNEMAVPAVATIIPPGGSFKEEVWITRKLQPGQYRLVKQIEGNQTPLSAKLAADFEVS